MAEREVDLAALARERIGRVAAGAWTAADVARLANALILDPERFVHEPPFRSRVVAAIAAALPPDTPAGLRDQLVLELSRRVEFDDLAAIEAAWGIARRPVADRLTGTTELRPTAPPLPTPWPDLRLGPAEAPIGLSIYSLASRFFTADEAAAFLAALRQWAPERAIAVLTDHPMSLELAAVAEDLGLHLSRTWSHTYSPWPRDPMSFLLGADNAQVAVLRPNRQPGRESDSLMALELIQDLPTALDDRFGPLGWTIAPVPFHNGNLLAGNHEIWLSLHSLEPRILELLRTDRVPAESFVRPGGVERYVEAARLAATEIGRLFGRPARFVHPLPLESGADGATTEDAARAMMRLGGGAGFDLDSVATILPLAAGGPAALVGDLGAGIDLLATASEADLETFRSTYGLGPAGADLRTSVDRAHRRPRATGLQSFVDLVAEHLAIHGFAVYRLPLLLVPAALIERPDDPIDEDFLIGWNNVVLESAGDKRRAEGFASRLAPGDARARALFAELGYELELLPPLVESVLRNGGYRCASNHIRNWRSE